MKTEKMTEGLKTKEQLKKELILLKTEQKELNKEYRITKAHIAKIEDTKNKFKQEVEHSIQEIGSCFPLLHQDIEDIKYLKKDTEQRLALLHEEVKNGLLTQLKIYEKQLKNLMKKEADLHLKKEKEQKKYATKIANLDNQLKKEQQYKLDCQQKIQENLENQQKVYLLIQKK